MKRKSDPMLAAWDRLQAAQKAHSHAYNAWDEAEAKAHAADFKLRRPSVSINGYECTSVHEVRRRAQGLPRVKARQANEAMLAALADAHRERREAGLVPFDTAEKRTRLEWDAAMNAIAMTHATTSMGVILKLQLIALELRDGPSGFGEAILASAIGDLSWIARKRR